MKKLISIITINKDNEKYIEKTIKSIIYQNKKIFELIIIDGKSKDGSVKIIKKYNKFIKYWETSEDKNISDAFNKGLSKCSTDWVLFINSDDYLANNNVLNNISSDLIKFKNFDMLAFKLKVKNRDLKQTIGIYGGTLINEKKLIMYNTFPHQALITNRKFFLKYGNFSTKFPIAQDYEILLRAKKIKLKKIDKIISIMRDGGITNQNKVKSLKYFKLAQIKNKTNNILIINIIYFYGLFKLFIKSIINKF